MSIVEQEPRTFVELSRPQRVAALMWVAEHAGILADGYGVSVSATYGDDALIGDVSVQGEAGALQSLVARLGAVPDLKGREGFRLWVAFDEGVRIRLVEEVGER